MFVQADEAIESMRKLLGVLTKEAVAPLRENAPAAAPWTISGKMEGFGGAMAGLEVHPGERADGKFCVADLVQTEATPLISSANGEAVFFTLSWKGVPIFICLAGQLVDLDDELKTPNFDGRDHFFSAVPIVLYLRWAFADSGWQTPAVGACLIIDDPLLKPRYGFVRFRSLLALMEEHDFSTNIAFIPWNWRRSDPDVVRLFRDNPDRFSLSVHGCDHTAAEFGTDEIPKVRPMIERAAARMSAHETRTGLAARPDHGLSARCFLRHGDAGVEANRFHRGREHRGDVERAQRWANQNPRRLGCGGAKLRGFPALHPALSAAGNREFRLRHAARETVSRRHPSRFLPEQSSCI